MDITLIDWMAQHGYDLEQARFMRDEVTALVGAGIDYEDRRGLCRVIGEHASKGNRLPVYSFARPDLGLRLVFRDNFHNWKMSVVSADPIDVAPVDSLFHTMPPREPKYTGNELAPVYFEGFSGDLIFGYHSEDPRRFSAKMTGRYSVWAVVHCIMRNVGALPRAVQTTEVEHRAVSS